MKNDPRWPIEGGEWVHDNPFYRVRHDRLRRPDGAPADYFVIHPHRQGVGVAPIGADGRILLVQQWRHPVQKLLWEIPAGGIDENETPVQAVTRELFEETGYQAESVEQIYEYHPQVGSSAQTFHICIARDLKQTGHPDPVEIHRIDWFTPEQIEQMLDDGDLQDGMTLTALLLWLWGKKR